MIIHNDRQELQKALQYVEEELKKYNLNRREAMLAEVGSQVQCNMVDNIFIPLVYGGNFRKEVHRQ